MATTIITKNGSGAPLAGDLTAGELAVDLTNKRLYSKDSGGTVIELGTNAGSSTFADLTVSGDLTVDTNTLYVDSTNNRVGIGTTSPGAKLSIAGGTANDYTDGITLRKSGGNVYGIYPSTNNLEFRSVTGGNHIATFDYSGNVGIGTSSPNLLTWNKGLTINNASGNVATEYAINGSAIGYVGADASTMYVSSFASVPILFRTGNTERMRIDSSGSVGIGAVPVATGFSGTNTTTYIGNTSAAALTLDSFTSGVPYSFVSDTLGNLSIYDEDAGAQRLVIDSNGNVGIGDSSPDAGLTVHNNAGAVIANSNIARQTYTSVGQLQVSTAAGGGILVHTEDSTASGFLGFGDGAVAGRIEYAHSSDAMSFMTGSNTRMTLDASGNLLIGYSSTAASKIISKGVNNNSSNYSLYCLNSDSTLNLYVRNDGIISTGTDGNSPYNYTVSGRDLYVNSVGVLGYLSSTRASKANIQTLGDISWLYNLNPVSFNYRQKDDETSVYMDEVIQETEYGLIAEEVEQVNSDLCFYDADEEGNQTLAGVTYRKLIPVLTKAIQEQQAMIETLQAQVAELQGAN